MHIRSGGEVGHQGGCDFHLTLVALGSVLHQGNFLNNNLARTSASFRSAHSLQLNSLLWSVAARGLNHEYTKVG